MSEVMHNQAQEFWSPPVVPEAPSEGVPTTCECGTEFMIGARFCHACGLGRDAKLSSAQQTWARSIEVVKSLELHRIQEWVALPTASFVAFLAGLACVLAALMVGIVYSAQNLADFQAIQLWRIEWLVGALVAFVAGVLLKR
ncbi:MAG: hypothetical protein JOZ80_02650 [Acidobacteriaceae bacterium]|nr:hypothetical protein [Acidobacteriaceae bacterium]